MKKLLKTSILAIVSCLIFAAAPLPQTHSEDEALFVRRIAEFWKDGEKLIVKSQIKQFLKEYPKSEFTDSFLAILGDLYWQEKSYKEAYTTYNLIQTQEMKDKVEHHALDSLYHLKEWSLLGEKAKANAFTKESASFYYAESLWNQKQYDAAKPIYERLLSSTYKDHATLALADINRVQGNPKRAVELYLSLAESHPESGENFLFQAAQLQKTFDVPQAILNFSKVASLKGKKASQASLNLAILLYEAEKYKELINNRQEFANTISQDHLPLLTFVMGRSYFSLNQFQEAIDNLEPLLKGKTDPETINKKTLLLTLLISAHQLNQIHRVEEWAIQFEKDFPNDPELAKVIYIKALTYFKNEKYQEAELYFTRILKTFPAFEKFETVQFENNVALFKQGLWSKAREGFIDFFNQYPTSTQHSTAIHYAAQASLKMLGEAERRKDSSDNLRTQLLNDIQMALVSNSSPIANNASDYLLKMAQMLYELKQYQQAKEILESYVVQYPNEDNLHQAHFLLALCCKDGQQDLKAYAMHNEKVLTLKPAVAKELHLHRNLFSAYLQLANVEPQKDLANSHLNQAAAHLYTAMIAENEPFQIDNKRWLANYYYQDLASAQNDYMIDPLDEKNGLAEAKKTVEVYQKALLASDNAIPQISLETLDLETDFFKLSNALGWSGQRQGQIALLKSLLQQQKEHPEWPWKFHDRELFSLGYAYLSLGEKELAFAIFSEITNGKVVDSYIFNASQLYFSRLAFAKLPLQDRHLTNETVLLILKNLKNQQIRKVLLEEPIHLEAAIDYATIRASLEPASKQEEHLLFLLNRIKEDFSNQEDLNAKDYHAERQKYSNKNVIYQAYLLFVDARITQIESHQARKIGLTLEADKKNEIARTIYKTLTRGKFAVSKYLVNLAQSQLQSDQKPQQ